MFNKIISTSDIQLISNHKPFPEEKMQSLLKGLDPRLTELYKKSVQFFNRLNDPAYFNGFYQTIKNVADIIMSENLLGIEGIFGVGHLFYGNVDFRYRMYNTLKQAAKKTSYYYDLGKYLLPDIDLFIVYKNTQGPISIFSETACLKELFVENSILFNRQWNNINRRLYHEITNGFKIANRNEDPVDEFFNHGRLHVDLFPIPADLFKESLNYTHPQYFKKIVFFRDMLFTCHPLNIKNSELLITLNQYRKQVVRDILKLYPDKNPLDMVIHLQPHYKNFISTYKELPLYLQNLWKPIVDEVLSEKK
ncbi:MAG: hypothetical protein PHV30_06545 [Candidatus Margulisbacteria bacterium]|nr:hypothetical protein [Candidatus Margulisiibacteriota bacterium]